jgi:hypothetical protein
MMVVHLDRLVPYQGAARDERTQGGSGGSGWRVIIATPPKNQQEETPRERERERDVASTALGRKGTAIHH